MKKPRAKNQEVWVLEIEHRHGVDHSVFTSKDKARNALGDWVEQWWETELPADQKMPAGRDEKIDAYFDAMREREWYSLTSTEVTEQRDRPLYHEVARLMDLLRLGVDIVEGFYGGKLDRDGSIEEREFVRRAKKILPRSARQTLTVNVVVTALRPFGTVTYEHTGGGIGTLYLKTPQVPAAFAIGPFHWEHTLGLGMDVPCDDALYVGFDESDDTDDCETLDAVVAAITTRLGMGKDG